MPLLTILRHGQSTYNLENRFTGSLDPGLSPLGILEAQAAGLKLKSFIYGAAYTSVLKRAQQTLEIVLKENKNGVAEVFESAALNERMYGNLQGMLKTEAAEKFGALQVEEWRRSFAVRPPGGESLEDTYNRTVPYYIKEIEPRLRSEDNVLIVAHGNSLRALVMYLENLGAADIVHRELPTGIPVNYTMDNQLVITEIK